MKTFSRLSLFTLIFLGFALMLLGNVTDVHAQAVPALKVEGDDATYEVGTSVEVIFTTQRGAVPVSDIQLIIDTTGAEAVLDNITVSNGGVTAGGTGRVVITGDAARSGNGHITAEWAGAKKSARADFTVIDEGNSPAVIVVGSPDQSTLGIDDTFTQVISIENRGTMTGKQYSTLPLSAWQMDVVFNPLILAVEPDDNGDPSVTLGDALGSDALSVPPVVSKGKISVSQALVQPTGIPIAYGEKKTLLTIKFRVLAVSEEQLGLHNVKLQSSTDDAGDGTLDRISFSILVSDPFVATHKASQSYDVNSDKTVDIKDLVIIASSIGMVPHNPRADVNGDGSVNVLDLVVVYTSAQWGQTAEHTEVNKPNDAALAAPSVKRNVGPDTIQNWIDLARIEDDGSAIFDLGIANLEALIASRIPSETRLLLNYPNPFNPETWIPYQLAEATKVTVMIHAMNGSLIRTLELGHQAAGTYKSKSQAAYWDGRNEFGEQVASGLYFYTLTAGDFSATHKMLVRK